MRREVSSDDSSADRQTPPERPVTHAPLTGEQLAACGASPLLAGRILDRLAAMPAADRQRLEAMLAAMLI